MEIKIREMAESDRNNVLEMMQEFYSSPAVFTDGSDEIFLRDIDNCVNDNPFLEGFIFDDENNVLGYAMIAKSFSTEFGKQCIWIEDLYIKNEYRGNGIGKKFMGFVTEVYPDCVYRLEVEEENERAVRLYEKSGFTVLPYMEMKK